MLYPLQLCSSSCYSHVEPQKTWNHQKSEQENHFKALRSAVSSFSSCITSRFSLPLASGRGCGGQMEEGHSGGKVARVVIWPVGWQGGFTIRCWCGTKCSQSGREQTCVDLNIAQKRRSLEYDYHRKENQKKEGWSFSLPISNYTYSTVRQHQIPQAARPHSTQLLSHWILCDECCGCDTEWQLSRVTSTNTQEVNAHRGFRRKQEFHNFRYFIFSLWLLQINHRPCVKATETAETWLLKSVSLIYTIVVELIS